MRKNILVIFPNSFPVGGAATNRILALCRGMVESGNKVNVLISRPTEKKGQELNHMLKGSYLGVEYEYATKNILWPDGKIKKLLVFIKGRFKTIFKICEYHNNQKIDIVISAATYTFFDNLMYRILSKLIRAELILTIDEYPWVNINREKFTSLYRWFHLNFYYKLFDGFIVITQTLLSYYNKLSSPKARFLHLPMTVEFERFNIKPAPPEEDYIAYCGGDPTGTKDGIDILIKAFDLVKDDHPKLKLYIAGKVHHSIHRLIDSLSLNNRVHLLGFISRDKVPELLMNAKALCLARPGNLQAEGGFPTKLGEYLASGRPTIITNVGEVSHYLTDGKNAFISTPGDLSGFAEKIRICLSDKKSKLIGSQGRLLAEKEFNYKSHANKLNSFLDKVAQ